MKKRTRAFCFLGVLMGIWGTASVRVAQAQPNPDGGQAVNPGGVPGGLPFGFPGGAEWQKMTPEQRRAAMLKTVDQTLRGGMTMLGFHDAPTQDAVVAFAVEQEKSLEPLRDKQRKVAQALINNALGDQQMKVLLEELTQAETQAREKRLVALKALDQKVGFSKKPRLYAFMTLTGLNGDQTSLIGGVMGGLMTTLGNVAAGAEPPKAAPAPN
jgi:hypothetical protein